MGIDDLTRNSVHPTNVFTFYLSTIGIDDEAQIDEDTSL